MNVVAPTAAFAATISDPIGDKIREPSPDPVFAAIEKHSRAYDLLRAHEDASEEDWQPLNAAEASAEYELSRTIPTTRDGARALVSYIASRPLSIGEHPQTVSDWYFCESFHSVLLSLYAFFLNEGEPVENQVGREERV